MDLLDSDWASKVVKVMVDKSMLKLIMSLVMSVTMAISVVVRVLIPVIVCTTMVRMVLVAMRVSRETMSLRVT